MNRDINHYENFPVASWLCPPRLRPPIAAIYHFARTADDLADEGSDSAAQRLKDLSDYRHDLMLIAQGQSHGGRWAQVFDPLSPLLTEFSLPTDLLNDLLDAFCQDIAMTRDRELYADFQSLLDYCAKSANPIGRLLLHLYGIQGKEELALSDHICTALQLINFWQDLSVDIPRGRFYLTRQDQLAFGVSQRDLEGLKQTDNATQLIAHCVVTARKMMKKGAQLVHHVPGRAGWELRAVVQGGLQILDKIERLNFTTLRHRPTLGQRDGPLILWRCLWM